MYARGLGILLFTKFSVFNFLCAADSFFNPRILGIFGERTQKHPSLHMQDSKQLNVKLPSDLYDLILKTGRSRKDIIIDALNMYFSINEHNQHQEPQQNDSTSAALIEQLQEKDKQISELHILLQTTLNQNMITSQEDENKKHWWKFWA